jgi:hypothetical protein
MELTTKDRYFSFFPDDTKGASSPAFSAQLGMRIASVSKAVERFLERNGRLIEVKERVATETPTRNGLKGFRVAGYPIASVASLTVYNESIAEEDYTVDKSFGNVYLRNTVMQIQPLFENCIRLTYTGGMALDTEDFIANFPDIESAVLMQINFELQRYKTIANKTISNGASSSTMNHYGLMEELVRILESYSPMVSP